tara:strand:- start:92 stop:610 length:519 start_codon:yes stop_codon:yes gene_type:complete
MKEETIRYFEEMAMQKEAAKASAQTAEMEKELGDAILMRQDTAKLGSERAKQMHRVKDASGKTIQYFRSPSEIRQIQSIRFEIEDLLSPENMQAPDKMKRFQDLMNRYVIGDEMLPLTGEYDRETARIRAQYERDSKRWDGDPYGPNINPLRVFDKYKAMQVQRARRVDLGR